jgi:lysozyme
MDRILIEDLITRHEGRRASVYKDTEGNLTIGCGFNLDADNASAICSMFGLNWRNLRNGSASLTDDQIDEIFEYQVNKAIGGALTLLPNFQNMPDQAQAVVVDQIFNLGLAGFSEFHLEIAALKAGDWAEAAAQMKDSDWYDQVPNRAKDDIALLESI